MKRPTLVATLLILILVNTGLLPWVQPTPAYASNPYWRREIIDYGQNNVATGRFPSLAFKPSLVGDRPFEKQPVISYSDGNGNLHLAIRGKTGSNGCGPQNNWQCTTIDQTNGVDSYSSLAFQPNDSGRFGVLYTSRDDQKLMLQEYSDAGALLQTKTLIKGDADTDLRTPSLGYDGTSSIYALHRYGQGQNSWNSNLVYGTGTTQNVEGVKHADATPRTLGYYASLTQGYNSKLGYATPRIAYRGAGSGALRFTEYAGPEGNNKSCATWDTIDGYNVDWMCPTVDPTVTASHISNHAPVQGVVGDATQIAYYDSKSGDLRYARYVGGDSTCGNGGNKGWRCEEIDTSNWYGGSFGNGGVSMAVHNGTPYIAYIAQDHTKHTSLKLATYASNKNGNCGPDDTWHCEVVDGDTNGAPDLQHPALAISPDGTLYIAYHNATDGWLQLATYLDFNAVPTWSKSYTPSKIEYGATTVVSYQIKNTSGRDLTGVAWEDELKWQQVVGDIASATVTNTCGGTLQITGAYNGDSISYSDGKLADKAACTVAVKLTGDQVGEWNDVVQDLYSNEGAHPMNAAATLTITKANQTITFPPLADRLTTAGPAQLAATTSSKLPITFVAEGVCTVTEGVVQLTGQAGTCTITAKQGGNDNYLPATDVTHSFAVNAPTKLDQAITFAPLTDKVVGNEPFGAYAHSSSKLPITFAASGVCTVFATQGWKDTTVAVVLLSGQPGTCTITASQAGNDEYNAAVDVAQTFKVTAPEATPMPTSEPTSEPTAEPTQLTTYQLFLPLVTR